MFMQTGPFCPHFDVQKPVMLCTSSSHVICQKEKTSLLTPPGHAILNFKNSPILPKLFESHPVCDRLIHMVRAYNHTDTRNEL